MTNPKPRAPHPVCVGLISDTHGLVRPEIVTAFDGVQLILHAGDVGGRAVLVALETIAPVQAVYGNCDDAQDLSLTRERVVSIGGLTIHVTHGHELGRPAPELVLARYAGDIVVYGHTHRAAVLRDASGRVCVNPGAAGPRRFDVQPSVARLTIADGVADVAIISLG